MSIKRHIPFLAILLLLTACRPSLPNDDTVDLPKLRISISDQSMQQVKRKRAQALEAGLLVSNSKDYVDAQISLDSITQFGQIRLKGDWLDHLKGNKWSWRVKLNTDQALMGMQQFSVQHPRTRSYLQEWVYHRLLEQEDILSPRYRFVQLWLNDEYKGIYALEEHFDQALLAHQQQAEGIILKFNEDGFWQTQDFRLRYGVNVTPHLPDFEAAEIEPFQKKRTFADSSLAKIFQAGKTRLESLRRPEQNQYITELIDINYWAKFYAITDLCEAYHALRWHNMRFYYNTTTTQLYPIGFDGYGENGIYRWFRKPFLGYYQPDREKVYFAEEYFIFWPFNSAEFKAAYSHYLTLYSKPEFIDAFFKDIRQELNQLSTFLQFEFPDYHYDDNQLPSRGKAIREAIRAYSFNHGPFNYAIYDPLFEECKTKVPLRAIAVKAYPDTINQSLYVQNYYCREVQIEATGPKKSKPIHQLNKAVRLPPFDIHQDPPPKHKLSFPTGDQYVFYSIAGVDYWFKQKIARWSDKNTFFNDSRTLQIDTTAFLVDGYDITMRPGHHHLSSLQIIPSDYRLKITAGSQIDLVRSAAIFVYGSAQITGTAAKPVQIGSSDRSGRGVHFINCTAVQLEHVVFDQLRTFRDNGQFLNGAVSLYNCNSTIAHCTFQNSLAEDALNIVRSDDVRLRQLHFKNCAGDGLDIDFSSGVLQAGTFEQIGGDGIDLSGSTFDIMNIELTQITDKGLSVGEASTVVLDRYRLNDAAIGLAVKDGSTVTASQLQLENCDHGLAVFSKKPFFKIAKLQIEQVSFGSNVSKRYVLEANHQLIQEGQSLDFTHSSGQLNALFYPPE